MMHNWRTKLLVIWGIAGVFGVSYADGPDRLLTLGGPATEIVFALGAGEQVVAADASSLYPDEAEALPKVGYVSALGAEGLLSQRPELIVATSRMGPPAVVEQVKGSEIPLVQVESPHDEESLRAAIEAIGKALGREEAAKRLWSGIAADLAEAEARARGAGEPEVVFLLGTGGTVMAAGRDTQGAGILELAGGRNLFDGYTGYQPVSEEALLVADPDFIFVGTHGAGETADARERLEALGMGRLAELKAARIRSLDLGEYLIFGPRTGRAALRLATLLAEGMD